MIRNKLRKAKAKIKNALNYPVRQVERGKRKLSFYLQNYIPPAVKDLLPARPSVLNFMVNDVCNSKCIMCRVWEKKLEKELSSEELARVLRDPLFKELKYIGISGGEPTLRKDLSDIVKTILQSVPGLQGLGIITNAIQTEKVINSIQILQDLCTKAGVSFNVMVSLDGIGEIHDRVRGIEGNFESALKVIHHLREVLGIPVSIGCTISKENVWHVDEVLQFCKEENIYGRFRIAEFINRLYNEKLTETIRNFDDLERYHLALFFTKLQMIYETASDVKETYKNIVGMLVGDGTRRNGCPYRSNAVGLDSRGNLLFCSPKSPVLGSCLERSAKTIYQKNIAVRRRIIEESCPTCIHDYHSEPTPASIKQEKERQEAALALSVDNALQLAKGQHPKKIKGELTGLINPLIIGWYGTETAGDKAILADIIFRIRETSPQAKISVASMYPFITVQTLKELGHEDITIVDTYSKEYLKACQKADAVLMGGGPLMGMEALGFVLAAFAVAAKVGIPTIIEGCGVGPLREEKYILAVQEIMRLSSIIKVRDNDSLKWVEKYTKRFDAVCTGDPANGFVRRWNKSLSGEIIQRNTLACYLRELTTEYLGDLKLEEFEEFKQKFEKELGELIRYAASSLGLKVLLMPMHTFVVGNDDRDFARTFAKTHLQGIEVEIGNKLYSPQDILASMKESKFAICMRFHSVLFAEALEISFAAIDYTGGGKILSFLKDRNHQNLLIDRNDIAAGKWKTALDSILEVKKRTDCAL